MTGEIPHDKIYKSSGAEHKISNEDKYLENWMKKLDVRMSHRDVSHSQKQLLIT